MQTLIWPLVLLLGAVALILLELFVPSGGLIGVLAAIAFFGSVGLAFAESFRDGTIILLIDLLVLPCVIALAVKIWPHTPFGRRIMLRRGDDEEDVLPEAEEFHLRGTMLGKRGIARTELLPSGDVEIDGRVYDAVSDGVAIEPGQIVRVIAVRTQRLVVRPISDQEQLAEATDVNDVLSTPVDSLGIDPLDDPLA